MKFLSQINVNTEYTLPIVDGNNGQVLTTDGSGAVYWGSISMGAINLDGLTDVIITSPQINQILAYTIPLGESLPVWRNITSPYATIASPTFTGIPAAPTAPTATNTTQIATTAFVKAQGYITGYTETDTLASVTTRGNTTTNTITVGGATSNYLLLTGESTLLDTKGILKWESDHNTVGLYYANGEHIDIGQTQVWYVKNTSGSTILKGQVVMATGAVGNSGNLEVQPLIADGSISGKFALGIAKNNIGVGLFGFVMTEGTIRGIDTSEYAIGTILWANPDIPGELTSVEPTAPALKLPIAFVVSAASNGAIGVRMSQGLDLREVHDVNISSVANGQLLRYNNGIWENWSPNFLTSYTETDPIFTASAAAGITSTNISNWNTAYGWGNHALAGYATQTWVGANYYNTGQIDDFFSGAEPISGYNKSNWDTAFGWGDHAIEGYATQSYVTTAIANLVDSAPSTLDTLNELAAALGDDPNFATTVTNSIATKATYFSSRFQGNLNTLGISNASSGIYSIGAGYTNGPGSTTLYGTLYTFWNDDISVQIWPTYNGDFYWRKSVGASFTGSTWRTIWDTSHFVQSDINNWNAAYNDRITSAAVTGTSTKTLTLTQGDGGTVVATWTDYDTDNDAQQLTWEAGSKNLSISNGNTVTLDGLATEEFVTSQGYITSYTETDTLQSVTSRGSSTNTDMSIGGAGGDRGLAIYHTDYGRIRFYQSTTNISTIHSFGTSWAGGDVFASGGAINITGNTGVTFGGWNIPDVVFVNGGTSYFRNNVGIGTTNPTSKLQVNGNIDATGVISQTFWTNDSIRKLNANASLNFRTAAGPIEMVLDGSGNLVVGGISPNASNGAKIFGLKSESGKYFTQNAFGQDGGYTWPSTTYVTGNDNSPVGNTTFRGNGAFQGHVTADYVPIDATKTYKVSVWMRAVSGSPFCYLSHRQYFWDYSPGNPSNGGWGNPYWFSGTPSSSWTEYSMTIGPAGSGADYTHMAGVKFIRHGWLHNYTGDGSATAEFQGWKVEELDSILANNVTVMGSAVATQSWVQSQNYLTSETDSQTLSWEAGGKNLTISNGNTVTLDGLATEEYVTSQGYITGYTEADTLASVTGRGNSTASNIIVTGGSGTTPSISIQRNIASLSNYWTAVQFEVQATSGIAAMSLHRNGFSHVGIYHDAANQLKFNFNSGEPVLYHNTGTIWGSGNDGSGSGLDADLLDGQHASAFAAASHTHDDRYYTETESDARYLYYRGYSTSGDTQTFQSTPNTLRFDQVGDLSGAWSNEPTGYYTYGGILSLRGANFALQIYGSHTGDLAFKTQWDNDQYSGWRTIITSANIGSQSVAYATSAGNADTVDGLHASSFLRSDVVDANVSGTILSTNNANVDGANFEVNTTNKTVNEYAYKVSRSGSAVGGIYIDGRGEFPSLTAGGAAITSTTVSNWNTAYSWGNHADYGYWNINDTDTKSVQSILVRFVGDVEVQGTFTESSSIRFKENIKPLEPALGKVEQLNPVTYNKIGVVEEEIGLIAEEVAELFPEVVTYNEAGQPQGIQYQRLSVILLKAVQELTERVNKLENK